VQMGERARSTCAARVRDTPALVKMLRYLRRILLTTLADAANGECRHAGMVCSQIAGLGLWRICRIT